MRGKSIFLDLKSPTDCFSAVQTPPLLQEGGGVEGSS